MGIARSVMSVQFKNKDDNHDDEVAPPSQHTSSASGSAEQSSDSCPTNAHSSLPKCNQRFFSKV